MVSLARSGFGFTFFDPHGDAVQELHNALPSWRKSDVIYLDVTNPELALGYNVFRYVTKSKRSLVASSILNVFHQKWRSAWGPKMENILRQCILTLLSQKSATMADLSRLLSDGVYRSNCLNQIDSKSIRSFWINDFPKYRAADIQTVQNKVSAFLSHTIVNKVLVENKDQVSFRRAMDENKIVLINLSIGSLGSDVAELLGSLLLVSIASSIYSRTDLLDFERKVHSLFLDEFHWFSDARLLGEMLAQVRKFGVGMVFSTQVLAGLDPGLREILLGNIGSLASFRLGPHDARLMEKIMYPYFKVMDFISLGRGEFYLQLLINARPTKPFSAETIL